MRTRLLSERCDPYTSYSAGDGDTERYEYECPCGKGRIIEEHDNIPGCRSHDVTLHCAECEKRYRLDISRGVREWELIERQEDKNG